MEKKQSAKGGAKKRKASRKISDLAPERVRGGKATAVRGGAIYMNYGSVSGGVTTGGFEKWIE